MARFGSLFCSDRDGRASPGTFQLQEHTRHTSLVISGIRVRDSGRLVLCALAACSFCTLSDTPEHARKSNYHAPEARPWREMPDVASHPVPCDPRSACRSVVDIDRPQAPDARQEKSGAASSLKRPVGSASGQSESASADATGASSAPRFSAFGGDRTANRSLMHSATALCVIGIGDF